MAATDKDRAEMLRRVRERLQQKKGGYKQDPNLWKAPQVGVNEEFKVKCYVLPPLEKGETCTSGKAAHGMDGLFFTQVGDHWINRKRYPCPRVYDGDECAFCQLGFDLLSTLDDKKARSETSRKYLPRTQYVVNLWFPPYKGTPDDLKGQVKYYAMPKTIFDKLDECLQRDNAGDDPDDPAAWGLFYETDDAIPLSIVINRKGDYNSYVDSKLLANGRGPIAKSAAEIKKILAMRHDIPAKYPERTEENRKALQGFIDELYAGTQDKSDDDGGFDADETKDSTPVSEPETKTKSSADAVSAVDDPELQKLMASIKKQGAK